MTISEMEHSIRELKTVVTSLEARADRLQAVEGRIDRIERHLRFLDSPRWQPYHFQPWDEADYMDLPGSYSHHSSPTAFSAAGQTSTSQPSPTPMVSQTPPTATTPTVSPKCKEIESDPKNKYLLSSEIRKDRLQPPDSVVRKYCNLKGRSKAGLLAVKLAKEAFFGEDVMIRCTVSGKRQLPALPFAELNQLKQRLFLQFSEFWNNPAEFEETWAICVDAINQSCKHVRSVAQKKGL